MKGLELIPAEYAYFEHTDLLHEFDAFGEYIEDFVDEEDMVKGFEFCIDLFGKNKGHFMCFDDGDVYDLECDGCRLKPETCGKKLESYSEKATITIRFNGSTEDDMEVIEFRLW